MVTGGGRSRARGQRPQMGIALAPAHGYWLVFGVPSTNPWPVTLVLTFFSCDNIPLVQSVLYSEAGRKKLLENPAWLLRD